MTSEIAESSIKKPGTELTDARLLLLHADDNVLVACRQIEAQESVCIDGYPVIIGRTLSLGHKVARCAITTEEKIIKYGVSIGSATCGIARGEHVHVHNMESDYTKTYVIENTDKGSRP